MRDLARRKFQHLAAHVLDGHAQTLKAHDGRLTIVTDGLVDLTQTVTQNAQAQKDFTERSFWQRLRWLVRGR